MKIIFQYKIKLILINTTHSEGAKMTNDKTNMYNVTISLFERQSNYAHDLDRWFCHWCFSYDTLLYVLRFDIIKL